jgi:hypothetical protein
MARPTLVFDSGPPVWNPPVISYGTITYDLPPGTAIITIAEYQPSSGWRLTPEDATYLGPYIRVPYVPMPGAEHELPTILFLHTTRKEIEKMAMDRYLPNRRAG